MITYYKNQSNQKENPINNEYNIFNKIENDIIKYLSIPNILNQSKTNKI